MAQIVLTFFAVIFFAISFRGLLAALNENLRLQAWNGEYSIRALQFGRGYKIAAWGLLTFFFFVTLTYFLFQLILS